MTVRPATPDDLEAMVVLAAQKRAQYSSFAPMFHRPAASAVEVHRSWLRELVDDEKVGVFLHEDRAGKPEGFVVATVVPAPPVYDPGGLTCLIDDFMVEAPSLWSTAGRALLAAARAWAEPRGAVQAVVVCGPRDLPKRQMLLDAGLEVVTEWFTAPYVGRKREC